MNEPVEAFYDNLAEFYDLIFEDWNRSIATQASILGPILERYTGKASPFVLDCACGIGTQTLGLARRGHMLVGSDLSRFAVERARREAEQRKLQIQFHVADMRSLASFAESGFDSVLAADNALPHLLSQHDLETALVEIRSKLVSSGVFVATLRDYDSLISMRPTMQPPTFYEQDGKRRIVHQVWQWNGDEYTVHLYITIQTNEGWEVKHFNSRYRALLRADLDRGLKTSGFTSIKWLYPATTSFYQPIVVARRA